MDGVTDRGAAAAYRSGFRYLSLALLVIIPIISYELIGRNLSFGTVSWVEELCKLIELWVGMLFISLVQFEDRHIAASLISPRSANARYWLSMLRHLVFFVIGISWIWVGAINAYKESNMNSAGGLELPLVFTDVALPAAGLLIAATAIVQAVRARRSESSEMVNIGTAPPDL